MDNRILFLQNCLLNSSPHFIRLLSELLKFDWLPGQDKKFILEKSLFLKVESNIHVHDISN